MKKIDTINKYNLAIKNNIIKILAVIVILQPIIDLIVGVSIKFSFFSGIMSLIRFIVLLFLLYYFFVIYKGDTKRKVTWLILALFIYFGLYFFNQGFDFNEIKAVLRVFYLPLIFLILISIYSDKKETIDQRYLLISLFIYSFIIIVGFLTNTAFNSYLEAKVGTAGYFNAANEIGGIFAILLPFVFEYVFKKINIKKALYFLFITFAIIILGTKTPFLSLLICGAYYLIKAINRKNILYVCLISIGSIFLMLIIITKMPIYENIKIHAEYLGINSIADFIKRPDLIDHFLLGSRLKFLAENNEVYIESSINDKLLGIGYTKYTKTAEMDIYDIFYRHGIIGFILYFGILLSMIWQHIRKVNKSYILPIVLIVLISTLVGHILIAPAVSTFVAFIFCGFIGKKEIVK